MYFLFLVPVIIVFFRFSVVFSCLMLKNYISSIISVTIFAYFPPQIMSCFLFSAHFSSQAHSCIPFPGSFLASYHIVFKKSVWPTPSVCTVLSSMCNMYCAVCIPISCMCLTQLGSLPNTLVNSSVVVFSVQCF